MQHLLYWVYLIPMFFTKVSGNGGNLCSGINESHNLNVTYKISDWGLVTTLNGCGVVLALVQVPHTVWVLGGGSAVALPPES